jgi:hypothetical protein
VPDVYGYETDVSEITADETIAWLTPMLKEALGRGDVITPLILGAWLPEYVSYDLGAMVPFEQHSAFIGPTHTRVFDWGRFGELLRHELGWDAAYPACPHDRRAPTSG